MKLKNRKGKKHLVKKYLKGNLWLTIVNSFIFIVLRLEF